jgi:hypothetical protein
LFGVKSCKNASPSLSAGSNRNISEHVSMEFVFGEHYYITYRLCGLVVRVPGYRS